MKIYINYNKIVTFCIAIYFITSQLIQAQTVRSDTRGKQFYIAFMENLGSNTNGSKLRLYASCDKLTKLKIILNNNFSAPINYDIQQVNTPLEIKIPFNLELDNSNTGVSNKSVIVEADDEITIYGVSIRDKSADAFVAIPEKVLTPRYIVLSYSNGYLIQGNNGTFDTPSEFAVVATADNTVLRITSSPLAKINGNQKGATFNVNLNKGQVFFGQAEINKDAQDVSGTEILGNKPVAVFAGVKRASIPVLDGRSRDHLCEQIPPLETWGKNYIVTPHFVITPSSPFKPIFRILSAFDNTNWKLNGVVQTPLQKGIPVEKEYTASSFISSDLPVLIAQYEHSAESNKNPFSGGTALGDPFMMIIQPIEQWDSINVFQSIIDPEFRRHFFNITIHKDGLKNLTLDGQKLNANQFKPVSTTNYLYAQIEVQQGSHIINCDSSFGIGIYGFGAANSYGYSGSMVFGKLVGDIYPPIIEDSLRCSDLDGIAFDSKITDTGIDSIIVLTQENTKVTIPAFSKGIDTVYFKATLVDKYNDGKIGIKAIDSGGREISFFKTIPGFTLRTIGMNGNTPIVLDSLIIINSANDTCRDFEIENYGNFPQTITEVLISDTLKNALLQNNIKIKGILPITLKPGEKVKYSICISGWLGMAEINTEIRIKNLCNERVIANIPLQSLVDTLPPKIETLIPPCPSNLTYQVSESRKIGTGVNSVNFSLLKNCEVVVLPNSSDFPTDEIKVDIRLKDKYHDGYVTIITTDKIGNTSTKTDTLSGFTLATLDTKSRDSVGLRFGKGVELDTLNSLTWRCSDSIEIVNYGSKSKIISSLKFNNNIVYSLPPSIIPITISPHSFVRIPICIQGSTLNQQTDTVIVGDACGNEDVIPFNINMLLSLQAGSDWCNNKLSFGVKASANFITSSFPNPVTSGIAKVYIGLVNDENINVSLYDLTGNEVKVLVNSIIFKKGINTFIFDLSDLPSGSYTIMMVSNNNKYLSKLLITK